MSLKPDSVSLKEYVDKRFDDSDKAVQAALVAQEKAINKAEAAAERRFELLNELRQGVATKDQIEALEKIVEELKMSSGVNQGNASGRSATWGVIVTIIGLSLTTVALFINFLFAK